MAVFALDTPRSLRFYGWKSSPICLSKQESKLMYDKFLYDIWIEDPQSVLKISFVAQNSLPMTLFTLWPHQKTLSVLKYETHTDNFSAAGFPSFELSIDYSLYLKPSDCS